MTNPIRIGVTGSGFMGRTHVEPAKRAAQNNLIGQVIATTPIEELAKNTLVLQHT